MKKLLGYIGSYSCYWIGDLFSKILVKFPTPIIFIGYQQFMEWSCNIQDWAKLDKPWGKVN